MKSAGKILTGLLLGILLSGCGGGGGSGSDPIAQSVSPSVSPSVSIGDGLPAPAVEGTDATITFMVTLSNASDVPVTVDYAAVDGSAVSGEDYALVPGQLTFAPGEVSQQITVALLNDAVYENPESFRMALSHAEASGTVLSIVAAEGTGNIVDGDAPSSVATLADLDLSPGVLDQVFQPSQVAYTASVGFLSPTTTVTPVTSDAAATVTVNGVTVSSGSPSPLIPLVEGENRITVDVTDGISTSNYTLTVTRRTAAEFAQQAYIEASTSSSGDNFGNNLALSGDTLAVGVPFEGANSGAVYIFTRIGTQWSQQAFIKSSNTDADDAFGTSIALSGDTLAVGAYLEDSDASGIGVGDEGNNVLTENSGAVYVFIRDGNTWSQQAYIKASNTDANDRFGASLGLFGDTLVVGANLEDSSSTGISDGMVDNNLAVDSGAVYVFTREAATWSQQAYIKASNTDSLDNFGYSIALSADTLAVGAYGEDSNATGIGVGNEGNNVLTGNSGAVYVFTREAATWSQQAYIKASNAGAGDFFGWSLSLSNDTLAVGAVGEASSTNLDQNDNSLNRAGAVYVFTRDGEMWSQQDYIKASYTGETDDFGWSLALSGDNLAVGAPREDSSSKGISNDTGNNDLSDSGAVYLFNRSGADWSQWAYIKSASPDAADYFGYSVALDGDTLGAGTPGEDSLIDTGTGAAYIFR